MDVSLDPPLPQQCTPPPASVTDIVTAKTKAKQPETTAYVYVAVLDSGPGLKPGDLALLFQRFQQGAIPFALSVPRFVPLISAALLL